MQKLEVFGAKKLKGQISISGSKNASLPILAASLLSSKKIYLKNLPKVKDIETMINLLRSLGSEIKFNRNKLIIEKATEIGVTDFFPIISQNSERRKWNTERFEKVLISSIKQSQRFWLPTIHPAEKFNDFIKKISYKLNFLAHCKEGEKIQLKKISNSLESQVIVIGPEGDFTSEEIELAKANNYKMISLGNNRLRTETACIAAITLMKL